MPTIDSGETPVRDAAHTRWDAPRAEAALVPPTAAATPLPPREREARRWAVRVWITVAVFVFLYSVTGHTEQAPSYALVVRDNTAKVYLSPSCALGRGELPISSLGVAKQDGLSPDPTCEKSGGFLGATQTVMQEMLARMHLYPTRGTRWRADGSWKW